MSRFLFLICAASHSTIISLAPITRQLPDAGSKEMDGTLGKSSVGYEFLQENSSKFISEHQ